VAKLLMLSVPQDRDLLAAYGELSIRHEHLTHILRMTIRTLANLEVTEALDATAYDRAAELRRRIKTLARQRLGEGEVLLKIQAILERCKRATEKRNDLIHSVWGQELDGEALRRNDDHTWAPQPTIVELQAVGAEILAVTEELNDSRLFGWLAEGLAKCSLSKKSGSGVGQ
jgi:hypothetical protein